MRTDCHIFYAAAQPCHCACYGRCSCGIRCLLLPVWTAEYVENKSDDCGYRPADLWDIFPDYVLRIPHGGAGSKTQAEEAVSLAEQLPVLCLI